MKCSLLSRPMTCAHDWISRLVLPGDTVVDATAGNGTILRFWHACRPGRESARLRHSGRGVTLRQGTPEGRGAAYGCRLFPSGQPLAPRGTGPRPGQSNHVQPGLPARRGQEPHHPYGFHSGGPGTGREPDSPPTESSASCAIRATREETRRPPPWNNSFPGFPITCGEQANTSF